MEGSFFGLSRKLSDRKHHRWRIHDCCREESTRTGAFSFKTAPSRSRLPVAAECGVYGVGWLPEVAAVTATVSRSESCRPSALWLVTHRGAKPVSGDSESLLIDFHEPPPHTHIHTPVASPRRLITPIVSCPTSAAVHTLQIDFAPLTSFPSSSSSS